jgi:hypothetical protein
MTRSTQQNSSQAFFSSGSEAVISRLLSSHTAFQLMTTISNDATVDIVLEISACQRMQFQEQLGHDQQLTKATTKLFRNP